jgi:hypothetical protein
MNIKNLAVVTLIGAALSVFFSTVPFLNFSNCLCCAPYWASAIFAVWLYRRMTFPGSLTLGQGVLIGMAIGLTATLVSLGLSLLGLVNSAELMNRVQSVVSSNTDIDLPLETGFHFNCNCGVEFLFGLVGGLIGGALFRTDKAGPPPSDDSLKPIHV